METQFTWIPFIQEFAKKLLPYRHNVQPLIDFIYTLKDNKGTPVTSYIKTSNDDKVPNIDPFSVVAIFCRRSLWNTRIKICSDFKQFLNIACSVPTDFEGVPVLNPMHSFYFDRDVWERIDPLWDLFEKIVNKQPCEPELDKLLQMHQPIGMLTMAFYWIDAYSFIALDSTNREYLMKYGINANRVKTAKDYFTLLNQVREAMKNGSIPYSSIPEFSKDAFELKNNENPQQPNTTMPTNHSNIIALLKTNKNLILTGAPGTGKTHMATELAHQLGADEKSICKVQFHPSYDYTDFVEGIRPMEDGTFKRIDGEFKAFCKRALLAQNTGNDILSKLNDDPKVWKVSLAGTGENPIRTDCMENGYIRIGWPGYGNVDDFNDFDNFTAGGRWILRNYQSVMRKGDIIVSCYSATETDAIGIVTDDYEFRAEGGDYPRYRPVKWLVKNIRENIVDINQGKKFTLSTIYISNIKVTDALAIVNKYNPTIAPANKPFVFIIDEINRGELSKIFGELFGAIEASYRGIKGRVRTQYQNMVPEGDPFKEGFYVPENVYIIGTMNDIDRSVESMDFAMRRRFTWKEISWVDSFDAIFEDTSTEQKRAIFGHMSRLNEAIEQRLGRAYQIGAAYFLNLQDDDFEALWTNHLEGLLFEYFRGERDAQQKVDELHAIYNGEESDTNS